MADPKRELIAQALVSKLQGITRAAGYYTDAGMHVSRRRVAISDVLSSDLPCLFVFSGERPGAEPLVGQGGTHHMGPVEFVVLGYVESEEPDRDVNLLEADVLKAVLTDERLGLTADTLLQTLEAGSVTDYSEYAPQGRGFVQVHFAVTYVWTHTSV